MDWVTYKDEKYHIRNGRLLISGQDLKSIKEIKNLGRLKGLRELYLYNNQINRIQGLDPLHKLQKLNLYGNKIKKINSLNNSRRYPGVLKGHYPGSNKFLIPSLLGLETYEKYSVKELTEQKLQAECTERIAMIDFDLLLLHNQFDGGKVVLASEWWLCDNCKYNYRLFEENCGRNNILPTLVEGTNKK